MTETSDPPAPAAEPRRPRRPRLLAVLLAVAVVAIVALSVTLGFVIARSDDDGRPKATPAAAAPSTPPAKVTMRGTISMAQYETPKDEFSTPNWHRVGSIGCEGVGGYDDMTEGATVTVYGAAGQIVAVGSLNQGVWTGKQCSFVFEIPNLPEEQFYQVEVSHRGKISVPRSEADQVSLSLG
ncbi:hypothetical protein [Actinomadura nitritigenes]|uniref:hypothetical protein n=1 Tax=Actinomadura nitritigenes TaxID=134602 RepID=UPI003D8C6541